MPHNREIKIETPKDEIYKDGYDYCKDVKCRRCHEVVTLRSTIQDDLAEKNDCVCNTCVLKERGIIGKDDTESHAA